MASLRELCEYLDGLLEIRKFPHDPSNNGLQFQGRDQVKRAVFAVDASEALFTVAARLEADFIFVHHGLSWGSGVRRFTGITAKRLSVLAGHGISLYAAHLPLDAHEMLGHNALLAEMIGLEDIRPFGTYHDCKIGVSGRLPRPKSLREIAKIFQAALPSEGGFSGIGDFSRKIESVGIISGGGAWPDLFDEIAESGLEALVTGEFTHEIWHPAMETGTAVLGLGHCRSETPGVIAVMEAVKKQFGLDAEFIDIPTGL